MIGTIHSPSREGVLCNTLQSEATNRGGQRIFFVPDHRTQEWFCAVHLMRIKTALNYWRNGYKWRASWILAQR